jgi:hypothetical protein
MLRARTDQTIEFVDLEPVFSCIVSFLGNDAITLRRVCRSTSGVRGTLHCEIARLIPPNLEAFSALEMLPGSGFNTNDLCHMRSLRIHGKISIKTSILYSALLNAPLEEFTCGILLHEDDVSMSHLVTFLLGKALTVLHLDEFVSDDILPLIGAHRTLRKLAISLDGSPANVREIAKCNTLREVRLEVPEAYPGTAFAPFAALPLTSFELNGCNSFDYVQSSLLELTTMAFDEAGEVDFNRLKCTKLTKLQVWSERATGDLEGLPLEWLVLKVRDSWTPMPAFPNLRVLAVNTLFLDDIELVARQSPLLKVFEFGIYYETISEYVGILLALSTFAELEYLGVFGEKQIHLRGIKDVCGRLKLLILDGEEDISPELRASAKERDIWFDDSSLVMNAAYPRAHLF